jgi:hypothetical protein
MDNAANNNTMLKELELLLQGRDMICDFDASDRKVMCFGHVIDLASGRVISGVTDLGDREPDIPPPQNLNEQQRDIVTLDHNVIRVIRASGTRRDAFDNIIKHGNTKMLFKLDDKVVQVKELQLLQSVRTRWDSVYYMLNRLHDM